MTDFWDGYDASPVKVEPYALHDMKSAVDTFIADFLEKYHGFSEKSPSGETAGWLQRGDRRMAISIITCLLAIGAAAYSHFFPESFRSDTGIFLASGLFVATVLFVWVYTRIEVSSGSHGSVIFSGFKTDSTSSELYSVKVSSSVAPFQPQITLSFSGVITRSGTGAQETRPAKTPSRTTATAPSVIEATATRDLANYFDAKGALCARRLAQDLDDMVSRVLLLKATPSSSASPARK
ncbi:hypothetical protein H696_00374 [Fonticula alba]|uniref:Signal peptidase complex subunit 2 n=1 Tax=Fonticula alba TaxID=691883 RepID=A0A058ZEG2_FONAL|nr:hypothetical protein H696_00374 [Fonticula alba]KCV72795.1 hypothetical protein H696_00374 [Fonticula alba]|eukprot:XP_009492496.1 hypothetical protein H696_00374 [Fonticula alba]